VFGAFNQFLHLPGFPIGRLGSGQPFDLSVCFLPIVAMVRFQFLQFAGDQIIRQFVVIVHSDDSLGLPASTTANDHATVPEQILHQYLEFHAELLA
jgi:hypothetical protein